MTSSILCSFVDGSCDEVVLSIAKKEFRLSRGLDRSFSEEWPRWTRFDREAAPAARTATAAADEDDDEDDENDVLARLCEQPLAFAPTYPYGEDPEAERGGTTYMRTRCPAWCDRVLYSRPAAAKVIEEGAEYDVVGKETCMGDHKPVYLRFELRGGVSGVAIPAYGRLSSPDHQPQPAEQMAGKCPNSDCPEYLDLLSDKQQPRLIEDAAAGGGGGVVAGSTRYVEIKDVDRAKLFKETTV